MYFKKFCSGGERELAKIAKQLFVRAHADIYSCAYLHMYDCTYINMRIFKNLDISICAQLVGSRQKFKPEKNICMRHIRK